VAARVAWARGAPEEAIEHLEVALQSAPWSLPTRALLVECLLEVGRSAEAARAARPLRRMLPGDPRAAAIADAAEDAVRRELEAGAER